MFRSAWTFVRSLFQSKIYEVRHCCSPEKRVYVRRIGLLTYILDPSFSALWERHLLPAEVLAKSQPVAYRFGRDTAVGFIAQDIGLIAPVFGPVSTDEPRHEIPVDDVLRLLDKAEQENPQEFAQKGLQALRDHLEDRNTRYYALPHHLRPDLLHM